MNVSPVNFNTIGKSLAFRGLGKDKNNERQITSEDITKLIDAIDENTKAVCANTGKICENIGAVRANTGAARSVSNTLDPYHF